MKSNGIQINGLLSLLFRLIATADMMQSQIPTEFLTQDFQQRQVYSPSSSPPFNFSLPSESWKLRVSSTTGWNHAGSGLLSLSAVTCTSQVLLVVILSPLLAVRELWMGSDSSISSHHFQTSALPLLPLLLSSVNSLSARVLLFAVF